MSAPCRAVLFTDWVESTGKWKNEEKNGVKVI